MKKICLWSVFVILIFGGFFIFYKGGFVSVYAGVVSVWDSLRVNFTDKEHLLRENAELYKKYENELIRTDRYTVLVDENQKLKKLLDIKDDSDFESTAARVISYGEGSGFQYLIADRGYESGIKPGMCAISEGGLVGVISDCGQGWCVVETLHSQKLKLSVTCHTNGKTYLLNGGKPELSFVQKYDGVKKGEILVSSGLSENIPRGIKVARVSSVNEKQSGEYKVLASPIADYKNISYILVLIL